MNNTFFIINVGEVQNEWRAFRYMLRGWKLMVPPQHDIEYKKKKFGEAFLFFFFFYRAAEKKMTQAW